MDQVTDPAARLVLSRLSEREREWFRLFCCEYTEKQIADEMRVSRSASCTYRRRLMQKMQITTDFRLMLFAINHGIYQRCQQNSTNKLLAPDPPADLDLITN